MNQEEEQVGEPYDPLLDDASFGEYDDVDLEGGEYADYELDDADYDQIDKETGLSLSDFIN